MTIRIIFECTFDDMALTVCGYMHQSLASSKSAEAEKPTLSPLHPAPCAGPVVRYSWLPFGCSSQRRTASAPHSRAPSALPAPARAPFAIMPRSVK